MTRPSAGLARHPATAQLSAFLLCLGMTGALLAAPALAQTGPRFAADAAVAVQTYRPGTAIATLNLPAATGGSGALSYTLTPAGSIPSGLSFSASARTVTGTPAAGAVVAALTYTVTDAGGNTDTLPVTIVVRPEPTITLAASSVTNEPTNTYSAVLSAQPASDVTLAIRLNFNFVEPVPAGFQADKSSLIFTPSNWDTPQTVALTYTQGINPGAIFIHHDIRIGGMTTHSLTTFYHVITAPRLVVSPTSLRINEGSSASYTVVLEFLQTRATATTITITPATSDATVATVGGPLNFIWGGASENWNVPQRVSVNAVAVGDADTQGGTATISHTQVGTSTLDLSNSSVAVSVVDSDSLRQLSVSVNNPTPDEGGDAVFTVALTGLAPVAMQPVTVDWVVSGAQAADYTVSGADTDGTLSFSGLGSQAIILAITDDALSEGEESLTVTLSNANRADITTSMSTITIGESDRPITLSFAGPNSLTNTQSLTEGASGDWRVRFTEQVTTTAPVEVDWRISFPAASQTVDPADAADFNSTSGTISIPAGSRNAAVTLTALGDSLNEAAESFSVTVSNPRGGGAIAAPSLASTAMVNGVIAASDAITVSIAGPTPPTATEGGSATFRVSINHASEASVSVPWTVNELSDSSIVGTTSGAITFSARTSTLSQNIVIPLTESVTLGPLSPTETLTVTLGTVSGGRGTMTGSGAMASVTVNFIGAARWFTVTGPATIAETDAAAESRDYTITLGGQPFSSNTAVTWAVTHGDTSDADFAAPSDRSGTVTFGPNDGAGATRSFSITVAGDNESESDETFTVQASVADDTADNGTDFGAPASTTITDDDSRSRVLTVTGPARIAENDDATNGVESGDYSVTLTGAAFSTDTVVTWTVIHGGTADADFLAASDRSGELNYDGADGDGSIRTFSITIAGDQMHEGAESFSVQLSVTDATSDGGTGYGDPAFTTISDDDSDGIAVYIEGSGVAAESSAGPTPVLTARFRVDLNGQTPAGDVVVSYTLVPGSSVFTVDDITATSLTGMLTLDADHATTPVLSANLNINPADDSLNEGAELFTVTATAAIGADSLLVINNSGSFTITANDFVTAQLSSTTALSEGATPAAAVTLTLDNTPTTQVTVDYTIGVDTDAATVNADAADYSVAAARATFAANTAPAAVTLLRISDDHLNESAELFTVTIRDDQVRGAMEGSGQNQMSTGASQIYTISASDDITVRIAANAATVNEGASAGFTVTLNGASAGSAASITVPYTVSGTTDTPTDANSGSIAIAAGVTTGVITLGIPYSQTLDDDSPDETLRVTLGAISAGAGGGTASAASSPNNAASVVVNYLSAAHTISFTNPVTSIVEGGSATYTVARSGPAIAGAGIVLSWAYAAGASNPASAADFAGGAPAGGTLTFTGAQTTQTFTIATAEDALSEPGETFTLSLSATPAVLGSEGGVVLPSAITVTIGESDRPVTLQIAAPGSDFTEGSASNFTVSFAENITTTAPITVYWRNLPSDVNTDTARNQDFEAANLSGSTVIAAGQSSAVIAITPAADNHNEGPETFTVRITSIDSNPNQRGGAIAAPVIGSTNDAQATIAASDPLAVRVARRSGQTGAVAEGSDAEFTVRLALAADRSTAATSATGICVTFSTAIASQKNPPGAANTASNADLEVRNCAGNVVSITADGATTAGGVLIPADQSSADFSVQARFDNLDEGAIREKVTVTLTSAAFQPPLSGATAPVIANASADSKATVEIENINTARTLAISAPAAPAEEGGDLVFAVNVEGEPVSEAFAVNWAVTTGAADISGATSGALNFGVSSQQKQTRSITLRTADDSASEPAETVTVTLTNPCSTSGVCAVGGRAGIIGAQTPSLQLITTAANGTISESDRPVTLQIAAPGSALTEGSASNFTVSFPENITTTAPITVYWRNLPSDVNTDTARNQDFEAANLSGSTVIAAGQSSAVIAITPAADNHNEGPETFTVRITSIDSNPNQRGGAIAAPVIGSTNDAQATIAASDPLAVRLARRSGQTGAVAEGSDAEFTVRLALAADRSTAATSATGICVTFSTAIASQKNPPGAANTASNADLEVRNCAGNVVSITADGATTAGGVLIPADQSSADFSVQARFDNLDEGAIREKVTVTLTSAAFQPPLSGATAPVIANASADSKATVEIENINTARTLAISAPAAPAEEGGDLVFAVNVEGEPVSEAFVVNWEVTTGAADLGGATSGVLNFGVSSQQKQTRSITLSIADDSASEPAEMVTVTLTNPCPTSGVCAVGGRAGIIGAQTPSLQLLTASANGTISESDRPVTLQIAAPGSDLTEGTAANFTVSFAESVTTSAAVIVSWRLDGLNAVGAASDGDFDAASRLGEVSIAPGQRSANLPITAADDAVNEAAETFRVLLFSARGGGAVAAPVLHATPTAHATIAASDPVTLRLSAPAGAAREGGDADFRVSLVLTAASGSAATSSGEICAMFTTSVSQSATLAAGANTNTAENPDITVHGCDGMPVAVSSTGQASGGVVIPAGQSSAILRIPVRFDNEDEGSAAETLTVTLRSAAHTVLSGAPALTADTTAAMALLQNSNALRTLEVSAVTLTGDEDSAAMPGGAEVFVDYTVRIQGADLSEEVTVNWNLFASGGANLPAAPGLARNHGGEHTPDFGAAIIVETGGGTVNADGASGALRFPVGAPTSRTVRVPVMQDALNEGAETLTLRVTDPCPATGVCTLGGGGSGATPSLQLTIRERSAVIPPSDPARLRIARVGSGTVVSGEGILYEVSLGSTFLNGARTPVLASTPLTVMAPLLVGGRDSGQSFTVEVPPGRSSQRVEVSGAVLSQALSGQSGAPMISLGQVSVSGGGTAMIIAPPVGSADLPAPAPTALWELTRALPDSSEAMEGSRYEVIFTLRGAAVPAGGLRFDWRVTGSTASDGGGAAEARDFARAAGYTCGAAAAGATCTAFPSGTVTFTTGDMSQTVSLAIRDDSEEEPDEGRMPDGGMRAEGFTLAFTALSGTDSGRVEYAAEAGLPSAMQLNIPALRADLSVAGATAAEGASAVFRLTLSGLVGGDEISQPITVHYRVGVDAWGTAMPGDTATRGADYTAPETSLTIPAGATAGELSTAIEIPLLRDGVLEPRETFTLTITAAEGGGGVIRLVADSSANPAAVNELTAIGAITDDADQAARRRQRVGALATVLDRQTALLATDAISARLSRPRAKEAQSAPGLSIANRNFIGARGGAGAANAAGGARDPNIGLALYGASGRGSAVANAAFGGLGAGLAGAANMGTRTALPSLAEVLNGSGFRFANFADGIEVWGRGGYVDLRGHPQSGGLHYNGESMAAFIGADAPVPALPNLLAGLAVGWSAGNLDFTDRAGGFTMRGEFRNDALSVHPYFGWQLSPHANAWLVLGIGAGSVDIEENEGSGASAISRKLNGGDTEMRMFSTGITGTQKIGETGDLKLRFAVTRVHSRVDSGRFDDGALLPKTRGRSLRVGGEAEAGRRITLENGLSLRPFGTLRLRLDNASAEAGVENAAMDWGAGITAAWTDLGLDGRFAFRRQLSDTGDEEQGATLDVNFAPGATGQGIAIGLQAAPQHSLSGEIAYGVALRYFGRGAASRAALLTPYGRFHLGSADTRWAAGLRLTNPGGLQLGLEAGLDFRTGSGAAPAGAAGGAAASPRSYDLLLTGRLPF